MENPIFKKDPDAVLDYGFDWSLWLATGETIQSSSWTAETGITMDSDTNNDTETAVWVSGGTANEIYILTNRIITSAGRTDERSIQLRVVER